MTASKLYT